MISLATTLLTAAIWAASPASAASSLREWRFFQTADAVFAVRRRGKDGYEATYRKAIFDDPSRCAPMPSEFKKVDAYTLRLAMDQEGRLSAQVQPSGALHVYRKCDSSGAAPKAEHRICAAPAGCPAGQDVPIEECKVPGCRLTIDRAGKGPELATAEDLERPIVGYAAASALPAPAAAAAAAPARTHVVVAASISPRTQAELQSMAAAVAAQGVADSARFAVVGADGHVHSVAPSEAEAKSAATNPGDRVIPMPQARPASARAAAPAPAPARPAEPQVSALDLAQTRLNEAETARAEAAHRAQAAEAEVREIDPGWTEEERSRAYAKKRQAEQALREADRKRQEAVEAVGRIRSSHAH